MNKFPLSFLSLFVIFGLSLGSFNEIQGMQDDGNGRSWLPNLGPSIDYERAAKAFGEELTKAILISSAKLTGDLTVMSELMAQSFAKGITEAAKDIPNEFFESLNTNFANGGQGNEAVKNLFEGVFKTFADNFDQDGQGHRGADNFFATFADQFAAGGQGSRAFEEFFKSLGRQFQENGGANQTANDIEGLIRRQFQEGGNGDNLIKNATDFFKRQVKEDGELDKAVEAELKFADRTADKHFTFANKQANKAADKAKEFLKKGGKADEATKEWFTLGERNINRFADRTIYRNLIITIGICIGGIAGSATAYYGTRLAWRVVERNLFRPKLIIDSSKKNFFQKLKSLFGKKKPPKEMVFDKDLATRLNNIIKATRNIHQNQKAGKSNAKYRNLMLFGDPGTGKTMFAKNLAQESGLEWAYMSGSSFAKFKDGESIEALDSLFKWAKKSKGLMIFIDEAEAFLASRESMDPNGKAYQLLNNFLNYTGERSDRFMLVFATNHRDNIDSAMHRRIDDLVELPLPKTPERARVLVLYRDNILLDIKQNGQAFVDTAQKHLDNAKIDKIAQRTDGLSNGDLEGIINTIKTDADITDSGLVNSDLIDRVVQRAIDKHQTFAMPTSNTKSIDLQTAIA